MNGHKTVQFWINMLVISELCRYQHVFVHTHPPLLCAMSKEEYSCRIQIGTKVATMASSFQGLGCSMPGVCDSHSFPVFHNNSSVLWILWCREVATIGYRSGPEWARRFGHKRAHPEQSPDFCPDYLIETYLDRQASSNCSCKSSLIF